MCPLVYWYILILKEIVQELGNLVLQPKALIESGRVVGVVRV